jgi:predicted transcriptional regulator
MQFVLHLERKKEETHVALLKAPSKKPKTTTLQVRLEEGVKLKLENYAEFIDATPSYVMSEALKLLFRRDDDFKHWLTKHPTNGDAHEIEGGLFSKTV